MTRYRDGSKDGKDIRRSNITIDDVNPRDVWIMDYPYTEKEFRNEKGDQERSKGRPCIVLFTQNSGRADRTIQVIKCTTKFIKPGYEIIAQGLNDTYRVDCSVMTIIPPARLLQKIDTISYNDWLKICYKYYDARRKDEDSTVTTEQMMELNRRMLLIEAKLKAAERTDFGIPSKKKYPMPDEAHVRAAIRMFNHCDPEDEAELARNIKKYMKKYGIEDVEVSEKNRFSKYYHGSKNEETILESAKKKYHTYEDAKFVFDSLTDQEKEWTCHGNYKNTPNCVLRKCAYDNGSPTPVGFVELDDAYKIEPSDFNKGKVCITVAVHSQWRGKGIAKALVKTAVHWFKESEYGVMSWKADEDNKASIKLAEKCGFIHNYYDKKMKSEFFFITNGTKMKKAIDESTEIEEDDEEDNSVYFEEYAEDPADIAREIESMIQEMAGGGGPVVGMEINDQSVTTYNPGMFIISYGSKRVGKYDDDDGRSSGYAVSNDFCSKYIYVKKNGKAVREEGISFLRDRKISIYEFVGDRDKWFDLLRAIDEGTCDGEFYTALTGRTLYTDDQIYFDEHFKYYNPIKRRLDNDMTFNINEEFSLVEGKEWLLPVMDDEMMSLQEKVNNINPYLTIKEGPKGYYLFDEAHSMCSAHPVSKRDIEMYLKK